MSNILNLNFDKSLWFQGFRESKSFLLKHQPELEFVSDEYWNQAKYMNKEYNISSPTNKILGQYFLNILVALLEDYSNNELQQINLKVCNLDKLDKYTKMIISVLKNNTNIRFNTIKTKETVKEVLNRKNMRVAVKRGLYDEFKIKDPDLGFIYDYFKNRFLKTKYPLDRLIKQYYQVTNDDLKWLLIKAIINKTIREGNKQVAFRYIKELKEYKKNDFDCWNSKSFYILVFESKEKAINYLSPKINITRFLNASSIDYAESLVMKNYVTLLDKDNKYKKKILKKCLMQTPQDVDLWKSWVNIYGTKTEKSNLANSLFSCGYTDLYFVPDLPLSKGMDSILIKIIFLVFSDKNKDACFNLVDKITNAKLQKTVISILNNTSNIQKYALGDA